jgi:hypothetical protein
VPDFVKLAIAQQHSEGRSVAASVATGSASTNIALTAAPGASMSVLADAALRVAKTSAAPGGASDIERQFELRRAAACAAAGGADLSFEDVQRFHDRRDDLKRENASYVAAHPELQQMIADFVAACLRDRPEDAGAYAEEYFQRYAAEHGKGKR